MNPVQRALSLRPFDLALALARWPVQSQLGSRRNALLASTRLTEVTREHRDVEQFLDRLDERHSRRLAAREHEAPPWSGGRNVI